MKKKKGSPLVTAAVNILFLAAIALISWKIYGYVNDSRQTSELAEDLWERAAVTAVQTDAPSVSGGTAEKNAEELSAPTAHSMPITTEPLPTTAETVLTTTETLSATTETVPAAAETMPITAQTEPAASAETTPAPTATAAPRFTDAPDVPLRIDFEILKEANRETAAWLYHPDLEINLPVVHTDNNSFYLKHGFDRSKKDSGTLFIDCRNKGDFSDRNTIIYGHARKDRHMFGNLQNYKEAEFCRDHPFFYLFAGDHRFRLEIVAVGDTTDSSPFYTFPADEAWEELLQQIIEKSPYDFGIPVMPEDHLVTLSTCAYDYEDERRLVIARIDDPEGLLSDLAEDAP